MLKARQNLLCDEWNYKLTPIYGIYWMNFSLNDDGHVIDDVSLYSKSQLKDGINAKPFTDKVRAITIDMHSFNKLQSNCETTLDQWIYNIKNMDNMTTMPFKEKNNVFAHLETLSDYYAMDPEDRKVYDAALRRSRDYYATLESAKVEGLAEGRAEGREVGRAEGRMNEKYENARKMKSKGFSVEDIADITGLSVDDIEKL